MRRSDKELPLLCITPDRWAEDALKHPLQLLNDHAHLERKAASNALELLPRWPSANPPKKWVRVVTSVAKDEVQHLGIVTRILEKRDGKMSRVHKNAYAQALRDEVRLGEADRELVDRLLISALIEVRSAERFEILSRVSEDPELKKLYKSLWASEHGHYRIFLDLAYGVGSKDEVDLRWEQLLKAESRILRAQTPGPRMHSWV